MAVTVPLSMVITLSFVYVSHAATFNPSIDQDSYSYTTDARFVALAMGTRNVYRTGNNTQFKIDHPRMSVLMSAFSPCDVRLGGSWANFLYFKPDGVEQFVSDGVLDEFQQTFGADYLTDSIGSKGWTSQAFTDYHWRRLTEFLEEINCDLLFDVSEILQKDGVWDDYNFRLLLDFTTANNLRVSGFSLGNEPVNTNNKLNWNKTAAGLAEDYRLLRNVIREYPQLDHVKVVGPEEGSVHKSIRRRSFEDFLDAGGKDQIDAAGLHHYYFSASKATAEDFLNPAKFQEMQTLGNSQRNSRDEHAPGTPIYMTEAGSASGGGAPGLSETFIGTFVYLDRLELGAKTGVDRIYRHSFTAPYYAMIDSKEVLPNPDYYIGLLHKRLIEGPVFNAATVPVDDRIRIYAHCARSEFYNLQSNTVVFSFLNLKDEQVTLNFSEAYNVNQDLKAFVFQSGEADNLQSKQILLNDVNLQMSANALPPLEPADKIGFVNVPKYSLGFIVVPNGDGGPCVGYHNN